MPEVRIQATQSQREFLEAFFDPNHDAPTAIGTGGARGGGKTRNKAVAYALATLKYPGINSLLIRKGQLAVVNNYREVIQKFLKEIGANDILEWKVQSKTFVNRVNRSQLFLGYLDTEKDVNQYLSNEYARVGLEEATEQEGMTWDLLCGSNRSSNPACPARKTASTNPGGIGHGWFKERFVDPETRWPGHKWIPADIFGNPYVLRNTPHYIRDNLDPLPRWKRKQWLLGDWDAIAGSYFDVTPENVCEMEVPYWAEWWGGVDYGYGAGDFAVVYMATWQDYLGRQYAHIAREIRGRGWKLDEQAMEVRAMEKEMAKEGLMRSEPMYYADPAVGNPIESVAAEAGATVKNTWAVYDFVVFPAATKARVPGWNLIRMLMRGAMQADGTYKPILTVSPRCPALLKQLKGAVFEGPADAPTSEDLEQKNFRDDFLDALRYVVVSRFGLDFEPEHVDPYMVAV